MPALKLVPRPLLSPKALAAEIVHDQVLVTFDDGTYAFFSSDILLSFHPALTRRKLSLQ